MLRVPLGSGLLKPNGVAVDGAGNVYVSDFGNDAVKEILESNGSTVTLASVSSPHGIALDAQGNIYVCAGTIVEKNTCGRWNSNHVCVWIFSTGWHRHGCFRQPVCSRSGQ